MDERENVDDDISEQMGSLNDEERKRMMSGRDKKEEEGEKMTDGMSREGMEDDRGQEKMTGMNQSMKDSASPSPISRDQQKQLEEPVSVT